MMLWDLSSGALKQIFMGHLKEALSVAVSFDNRYILSASRDCTIKLWNTLDECRYTIMHANAHNDCVSCMRFSPSAIRQDAVFVSGSWDCTVKVWNLSDCKLRYNLTSHKDYVNSIAVSPDGSVYASGGKNSVTIMWDLAEGTDCVERPRIVSRFETLRASPLCRTSSLTSLLAEQMYYAILNWSVDGNTLFTGYSDGTIRVWGCDKWCNYDNQ